MEENPQWLVAVMHKDLCAVLSTLKPGTEPGATLATSGPTVKRELWYVGYGEGSGGGPRWGPEGKLQCGVACRLLCMAIFSINETCNSIER